MKELHDIIQAYNKACLQNKQTALATVVKVEGSSYRRPGARMLVTEGGEITGAISGGCLEGDALRKALLAIAQKKNKLEIYDTTGEDDATLGIQLGCNGIVYILFEPLQSDDANNPIHLLQKVAEQRRDAVIATFFNENKSGEQKGTCCYVSEEQTHCSFNTPEFVVPESQTILRQKQTSVVQYKYQSVLYQFVPPTVHLVVVGAGNDAQPLIQMANLLGWQTTLIDGRAPHATRQRFPQAQTIIVSKPLDALSGLQIDEQTAFVIMTHNYNYDVHLLSQLLQSQCSYIGVLGPKNKLQRMLHDIEEKGVAISAAELVNIYGPVGLDIGAETAEEIAVSVIAEIKAVLSGRNGTMLRDNTLHIHNRPFIHAV